MNFLIDYLLIVSRLLEMSFIMAASLLSSHRTELQSRYSYTVCVTCVGVWLYHTAALTQVPQFWGEDRHDSNLQSGCRIRLYQLCELDVLLELCRRN